MQGDRAQRTITWAESALEHRGASFIITARYIPIGRVAVNMTAGTTGFSRIRFTGLAAIAAISWSIYSVVLGIGAGVWLKGRPLLAVVVGVAGGLLLGVIVDQILSRLGRRRGRGAGGAVGVGVAETLTEPTIATGAGAGAATVDPEPLSVAGESTSA
jgi:membrane protein DedA with SNARE-associated domain